MKKKVLLAFLLIVISAATVALVGCGNDDRNSGLPETPKGGDATHTHAYAWQSDTQKHWEVCECNDVKNEGVHVDVLNNDTQADGKDGKCDVCGRGNYVIAFDTQGYGATVASQVVYDGGKASKPVDPAANDNAYDFAGWYADAACTTAFDFTAVIRASATAYAKWTVTIAFNVHGKGAEIQSQVVKVGDKATEPATPVDPAKEYVFAGWYKNVACSDGEEFNFDAAVNVSGTLYAKWVEDERPLVTFDMLGIGVAPERQRVPNGGKAVRPATDPADEDEEYLFVGWYADEDCTAKFDFNGEITADTTIYAKWEADTRIIVTFNVQGIGTAPAKQKLEDGNVVSRPEDPTQEGYTFAGWYTDADCLAEYAFDTVPTVNTTYYAKWTTTVAFDMKGHGNAIADKEVQVGKKVSAPANPTTDDDVEFDGWFADSDCTQAFDFDTAITVATTLYAKWAPTLPKLILDGQKLVTFGTADVLEFVFTAPQKGRYVLSSGNSNTDNCYYTTDMEEDTDVFYGAGYDSDKKYFDLQQGKSIIVTLYRTSSIGNDAKVCLLVNISDNEPFPAEGWVSGVYSDGTYTLEFNREEKIVTWNGNRLPVTYIGGTVDSVYFTITLSSTVSQDYVIRQTAEDTLAFSKLGSGNTQQLLGTLTRKIPKELIAIEKFGGVYTPAGAGITDNGKTITEIGIYATGNGYMRTASATTDYALGSQGSYFDQEENELYFGNYQITVNLDADGSVESINVKNIAVAKGSAVVYNRTKDTPVELPKVLPVKDSVKYIGRYYMYERSNAMSHTFSDAYGNTASPIINGYDADAETYAITYSGTDLQWKVVEDGADISVEVYKAGALYDTLTPIVYRNLVADGTEQVLLTSDFKLEKFYYFRVTKAANYQFTLDHSVAQIYYDLESYNLTPADWSKSIYGSGATELQAGAIVAVYIGAISGSKPESFTLTVSEVQREVIVMDSDSYTIESPETGKKYYVEFTASEAGTYKFRYMKTSSGSVAYNVSYVMDGTSYGYDSASWKYVNVDSDNWATLELSAGQTVEITLIGPSYCNEATFEVVKV